MLKQHIGEFFITSEEVLVCDPCYMNNNVYSIAKKAINGEWYANTSKNNEDRNTHLFAYSKDFFINIPLPIEDDLENYLYDKNFGIDYNTETEHIAVDSGQLGFFDISVRDEFDGHKYNDISNMTCDTKLNAGICLNNKGVASSSGYGDGEYECTFFKNNNDEIIAIGIVFIY